MLNEFQMHECKQIPTHMVANVNLESGSMLKDTILDYTNKSVWKLIYLTLMRPDMAHAVGVLN